MSPKTVFVSGSSRGIGRAIAIQYATQGYNVIINACNSVEELNEVRDEILNFNVECQAYIADVSDYTKVSEMFQSIYSKYPTIDVVINNAGISHVDLFTDTPPDIWHHIVDVNLHSVYNVLQHTVPKMIANQSGAIINISSIWGLEGASCEVAYSTTKGAINALTKSLAMELGPSNIRVNAIACGAIETSMNQWMTSEEKAEFTKDIALCRYGSPEEVSQLAYFLGSSESSYLTGEIIRLDGGI